MGEKDIRTNEYMSDNERFADIFNYFLYDGEQVIKPKRLKELDTKAIVLPHGDGRKKSTAIQKYRDVFKMLAAMEDDTAAYLLLGVEDQTNVHYAMPVRNMLYDAAAYAKQVEDIVNQNKAETRTGKKKLSGSEYLSGFTSEDKLVPVITLVVFWSANEWDGPKSVHDMFTIKDKRILKHVANYKINVIAPKNISDKDFEKFHTELSEALQFIKYSKNRKKLEEIVNTKKEFKKLDRKTVEVLNTVTNAKIDIPEGAKEVNMCIALEEMKKEAAEKAVDERLIDSVKSLMKRLKLSAKEAMDAMNIPPKDQKRYTKML